MPPRIELRVPFLIELDIVLGRLGYCGMLICQCPLLIKSAWQFSVGNPAHHSQLSNNMSYYPFGLSGDVRIFKNLTTCYNGSVQVQNLELEKHYMQRELDNLKEQAKSHAAAANDTLVKVASNLISDP